MTTTRSRASKSDQAAEAETASPEPSETIKAETTLVPSAMPLEPPQQGSSVAAVDEPTTISVADAVPDPMADGLIVEAVTRRPPADITSIFQPVTPHGTDGVSTLRLLEHTVVGKPPRTMTRLLVAEGSQLSGPTISGIMQRLRRQAESMAAVRAGD